MNVQDLHVELMGLAGAGEAGRALARAGELIGILRKRRRSRERDHLMADVFRIRALLRAGAGDLRAAIDDSRAALDLLTAAEGERDERMIAVLLAGHLQYLAFAGRAKAIRRLDHAPMEALRRIVRERVAAGAPGAPAEGEPPAVGLTAMASALVGYAEALHLIGADEPALPHDREALTVYLTRDVLTDRDLRRFCTASFNLARATPDPAEAKEVLTEAVDRLTAHMDAGHFDFAPALVTALYRLGVARRRLDDPEAVQSLVDAEWLLETLALPGTDDLARAIDAEITPSERDAGRYITDEIATTAVAWRRRMSP